MTTVNVLGIDLTSVESRSGETKTKFDGSVRIAIHHEADWGRLTATLPFKNAFSLEEAIADALGQVRNYGSEIVAAAEQALTPHRSKS